MSYCSHYLESIPAPAVRHHETPPENCYIFQILSQSVVLYEVSLHQGSCIFSQPRILYVHGVVQIMFRCLHKDTQIYATA